VLALTYSENVGGGDVSYASGALVASGFDLDTAVYISVECDAPSRFDDPLTVDAPRRGWWGDAYDADGVELGSRLWELERAPATDTTAAEAAKRTKEALAWLVQDKHVRAVDVRAEIVDADVYVYPTLTLLDGRTVHPGPFKVTGYG